MYYCCKFKLKKRFFINYVIYYSTINNILNINRTLNYNVVYLMYFRAFVVKINDFAGKNYIIEMKDLLYPISVEDSIVKVVQIETEKSRQSVVCKYFSKRQTWCS